MQNETYSFLDLESWLIIHYPQILNEYNKINESYNIQE